MPSRAEHSARRQSERLAADRRRKQGLRDLAAAIDRGDTGYRRLCDRLDEFGARLALVRLTLSTTPAGRPATAEVAAVSIARRRPRQREAMRLRTADGVAI